MSEPIIVTGLSNAEFLERYASPGRVGLCSGETLADTVIKRAQRHLNPREQWGQWSHAFVFQGKRIDGHHWVIESDLQFAHKHLRLGVQENRATKYHDEHYYTALAVMDFGLNEAQAASLLSEGLELVATRTKYSITELLGTLIALRRPDLRSQENVLSRDRSLFCSAFVQHLFLKAGVDLTPGVNTKNTTPDDLSRCTLPHAVWQLVREHPQKKSASSASRLQRKVKVGIRNIRRQVGS
jgi:hypothetical protein